jgi:hypothetical protein
MTTPTEAGTVPRARLAFVIWDARSTPFDPGEEPTLVVVDEAGRVWSPSADAFVPRPEDGDLPLVPVLSNNPALVNHWVWLGRVRMVGPIGAIFIHPRFGRMDGWGVDEARSSSALSPAGG